MSVDRIHLVLGLVWLLVGMVLGQIMGESGDHSQMPTHAHIMLAGGVLSIVWAVIYRVWDLKRGLVAWIQTGLHHAGALIMIVALYMLFGGLGEEATLGPVLGVSGLLIMLSVLIMLVGAIRAKA